MFPNPINKRKKQNIKKTTNSLSLIRHGETPLCASPSKWKRGSMTVESALVMPIFLLALVCVLYLFQVELLQQQVKEAMYDAAAGLAVAAHVTEDVDPDKQEGFDLSDFGIETGVGTASIQGQITDQSLFSLVVGGRAGIICTAETDDGDDDFVTLKAVYQIKLPITMLGMQTFRVQDRVSARKWTGYDPTESSESGEELVYITETGVAYHKDRGCAYLNPSIQTVPYAGVDLLRSSSGNKYYPCELCAKNVQGASVLITNYGNRYHTDANCSGLKRTIYQVPISEVGGRHACSKCAK